MKRTRKQISDEIKTVEGYIEPSKERQEFDSWGEEDIFQAWNVYFNLVKKLHKRMDYIPKKIQEEIWDDVYAHYEP